MWPTLNLMYNVVASFFSCSPTPTNTILPQMPKGVDQCQICILTHMLKDSFDTGFQMEGLLGFWVKLLLQCLIKKFKWISSSFLKLQIFLQNKFSNKGKFFIQTNFFSWKNVHTCHLIMGHMTCESKWLVNPMMYGVTFP